MADERNSRGKMRMKKEINLVFATAVMTGTIIGSGIFVSPSSIIQNTGSVGLALLMWALSGILVIPCILCYAELGCLFPDSGGEYNFFKHALGPLPAFLVSIVYNMVILPAVYALYTLTTAIYIFYPFYQYCPLPSSVAKLVSVWLLLTGAVINSVYVRYVARFQTFVTVIKVIALIIIVITGFAQLGRGRTEVLQTGFENTTSDLGQISVAIYTGFFAYSGWQYIFILLGEVQRPERIVPQATVISMGSVIILYILTNVAYFTAMTPEEMIASPAVAVTFAERTLGKFSLIVPMLVAVSTIGALNGSLLGGSRMPYAAARDSMLPSIMGTISVKYLTPWISLWFLCLISLLYTVTGEAVSIAQYLGFLNSLSFVAALWCILYLRWKQPHLHRPIKVPLPIVIILFLVMTTLTIFGLIKQPKQNGIAILIILSGIPAYLLGVTWKNKPASFERLVKNIYIVLQKCFMVTTEDKEE